VKISSRPSVGSFSLGWYQSVPRQNNDMVLLSMTGFIVVTAVISSSNSQLNWLRSRKLSVVRERMSISHPRLKDVSSNSLKELLEDSGSPILPGSVRVHATPKTFRNGSCAIRRGLSRPRGIYEDDKLE
jgi:hypothetical protein